MESKNTEEVTDETVPIKASRRYRKPLAIFLAIIGVVLMGVASYGAYIFASSPDVIRNPKFEHYHFRMQVVVDGKAENFGEDKYQEDYDKGQCNAELAEQPIHFHDKKDQFTHIHWSGMTGGMVLKYYGWNYIGGIDGALGYKLDDLKDIQRVNTHGNFLPAKSDENNLYVYTGDEKGYVEKNSNEFISQDLEQFFGTKSNVPDVVETSFLDKLMPKASASGTHSGGHSDTAESEEEKLTRINNLIGNVVIFAQKDAPTDQQIKDRFSKLEPLSNSTCGG